MTPANVRIASAIVNTLTALMFLLTGHPLLAGVWALVAALWVASAMSELRRQREQRELFAAFTLTGGLPGPVIPGPGMQIETTTGRMPDADGMRAAFDLHYTKGGPWTLDSTLPCPNCGAPTRLLKSHACPALREGGRS